MSLSAGLVYSATPAGGFGFWAGDSKLTPLVSPEVFALEQVGEREQAAPQEQPGTEPIAFASAPEPEPPAPAAVSPPAAPPRQSRRAQWTSVGTATPNRQQGVKPPPQSNAPESRIRIVESRPAHKPAEPMSTARPQPQMAAPAPTFAAPMSTSSFTARPSSSAH